MLTIVEMLVVFLILIPVLLGLFGFFGFEMVVSIRKELAETRYFNSATKMLCCTACAWDEKV